MILIDCNTIIKQGCEFIAANLAACIADELAWRRTGLLPIEGKLDEAGKIFCKVDSQHGMKIAQSEVMQQAMQGYLERADDAAMADWVIESTEFRFQRDERGVWWTYCKGLLVSGVPSHTARDAIRAAMAKQAAEQAAK